MKKYTTWIALASALLLIGAVLLRLGKGRKRRVCDRLVVEIKNPPHETFVTEEEIIDYATLEGQDQVEGKRMDAVSLEALENRVLKNPRVKSCEAYWRLTGTLYLDVQPYYPIARVIRRGKPGFYMDETGHTFPPPRHYSARTLLISGGYVNTKPHLKDSLSAPIRDVIQYIRKDPFWSVQITQLDIDRDGYMHAVPLVGDYLIALGYPTQMALKWEKLKEYYAHLHDQPNLQPTRRLDISVGSQLIVD